MVVVVLEAKERDSVSHHPDVAAATVVVWLAPDAILVPNAQDLLLDRQHVVTQVRSKSVKT